MTTQAEADSDPIQVLIVDDHPMVRAKGSPACWSGTT